MPFKTPKEAILNEAGIAVIELALAIILLIFLVGGIWGLHTLGDMKRNVLSSVYTAFNSSTIRPFITNERGDVVKWGSPDAITDFNLGVIDPIIQDITDSMSVGSGLFSLATGVDCRVSIGYLDVDVTNGDDNLRGVVTTSALLPNDPDSLVPAINPMTDPLSFRMFNIANGYAQNMFQKKINSEEGRVLMDPDTLPQFAGPASAEPIPETLYFEWAPFFVWGCEGRAGMLFSLIPFGEFRWSGIFVPKR